MEPKIIEKAAMSLVGVVFYGDPSGGEFAGTWHRLMQIEGDIPKHINQADHYGLEFYGPDFEQSHKWFYMASVEVQDLANIPLPMVGKTIPACTYAVFTVKGGLKNLMAGFQEAYETWLPQSPYQVAYQFDFEFYQDGRFKDDAEDSEIDIYIPVKPK
jgi:AraC family transcriptional regulator